MEQISSLLRRDREYDLIPSLPRHHSLLAVRRAVRFAVLLVPFGITAYLLTAPAPSAHLRHPLILLNRSSEAAVLLPPPVTPTPLLTGNLHCPIPDLRSAVAYNDAGHRWESPSLPLSLSASLSDRIAGWRQASPLAPREEWIRFNNETCDNASVRRTANRLHVEEMGEPSWAELSPERILEVREGMINALLAAEAAGRLIVRTFLIALTRRDISSDTRNSLPKSMPVERGG